MFLQNPLPAQEEEFPEPDLVSSTAKGEDEFKRFLLFAENVTRRFVTLTGSVFIMAFAQKQILKLLAICLDFLRLGKSRLKE